MNAIDLFNEEKRVNIKKLGSNAQLKNQTMGWVIDSAKFNYTYNFTWLGRPIIQFPQDIVAMQEIIWEVKPDLIIEAGIAHGGSLIFYASMLALLELTGSIEKGVVLGIDIDIREHNKIEIEKHHLFNHIKMTKGSSTDEDIIRQVYEFSEGYNKILVSLDSNHTHEHVLAELEAYAPLVSKGSYCVVFDTVIEDMPEDFFPDRPWGKGNNPKTAVWEFMQKVKSGLIKDQYGEIVKFSVDNMIEDKLLITVTPNGFLIRE